MNARHQEWKSSANRIQLQERLAALAKTDELTEDEDALPIQDGNVDDPSSDSDMDFTSAGMSAGTQGQYSAASAFAGGGPAKRDLPDREEPPKTRRRRDDAQPANLRSSSADAALEKAMSSLEKHYETFEESKLWETKIRPRQVEAMSKTLGALAAPLTALHGNPDAERMSRDIMNFCEITEHKFQFFSALRQSPFEAIEKLSEEHMEMAHKTSPPVLSKIFVWMATQVLKDIDNDETFVQRAEDFFNLISCKKLPGLSLRCFIMSTCGETLRDKDKVVEGKVRMLQVQLHGMWVERILRLKGSAKFNRAVLAWLAG